jgi:pSer/pThr/pTyr-binding forkhead associated (FHA) protein
VVSEAIRFLRIKEPGGAHQTLRLAAEPVVLGRDEDCTVQLDSPFVSRRHARIQVETAGVVLTDLDSHNGCLVNGRPVTGTTLLSHGDLIGIGDVTVECLMEVQRTSKTRTLVRPVISALTAVAEPAAPATVPPVTVELRGGVRSELPAERNDPPQCLRLDERTLQVWIGPHLLERRLSTQEFALLSYLYAHRDRICSRRELGDTIWGRHTWDPNLLYRLVHRLKAKIEPDPQHPRYLQTIPWLGYRLTP